MTDRQALALARLMRTRASHVTLMPNPFDLPTGYVMVVFAVDGFTCGISQDGDVSS
jgi:hypothetical protein